MAKKSRRKRSEPKWHEPDSPEMKELAYGLMAVEKREGDPVNEVPAEITGTDAPPEPRSAWLSQLRADVVNEQNRTAHTIAELEAWAAELASTIAFLRARK